MINIRNRIRLWICFWKSTLWVTIPVGSGLSFILLPLILIQPDVDLFTIVSHFLWYIPVGLIFSVLYKELSQKEEYYFYFNKGISRIELWVSSVLLFYSFWLVFELITKLWKICYL